MDNQKDATEIAGNRNVASGGSINDYGGVQGDVYNINGTNVTVNQVAPATVGGGEQTLAHVWQWNGQREEFAAKIALNRRTEAVAIAFQANKVDSSIVWAVNKYMTTQWPNAETFVITNVAHPNDPAQPLDPTKPDDWAAIAESFTKLLSHISRNVAGDKPPIHLFFNGPVALALMCGMAAGHNQYFIYVYHYDVRIRTYYLVGASALGDED